ncbi:MAG: hypothetical protein ACKVPY_04215 [Paracoccaceae bacterium]
MESEVSPLKVLLAVMVGLASIAAILIFLGYYDRAHECVRLENGAALGYEAVFDFGGPLFRSIVVPKLPDGSPIVHEETYNLRITNTSIYGVTDPTVGSRAHFAWRADTGTVYREDNPGEHDEIVSRAGHANWDIDIDYINAGGLMFWLLETGRNPKDWCRTRLITW